MQSTNLKLVIIGGVGLLAVVGWWVLTALLGGGPTACDLGDRSIFGQASWGWFPPGYTCTWDGPAVTGDPAFPDIVRGPSLVPVVLAVLAVLWPLSIAAVLRNRRQR
ncbi:hypothetical protein ACIA8G_09300 [Lentzea sp. NPDC051213]|uniref:hypothetical protein n=1 Tax=Lentzea sp. NPDC051213 TaxID=3364126 RepID=UPI0037934B0C